MKISKQLFLRLSISFAVIIFLDQISKILVSVSLKLGQSKPFISGVVSIVKVHNYGTIWGLAQGGNMIFAMLAVVVVVMIIIFLPKIVKDKWSSVAIGMILGGAVGNLLDRFTRGFVVDFIHLDFFDFPVFNIADMGIVISALILVVVMLISETKQEASK
ncbi:MAG: signal peptidase II [Caldisericia bacterium]|nr:signal peptidase II [Caldisericia bacterium]